MADTTGTSWQQLKSGDRHGTESYGQASDGTGISGNYPKFNANGSLTDSGIAAGSGGSSGTWVSEIPSGALNGSNPTFTLSHTPIAGTVTVYLNGVEQDQTRWVTVSGATITFTVSPLSIDYLIATYSH